MSDLAIAGALYFDHELAADPTPFAQLVRTLLDEPERVPVRQWHIDADNRKAPPPAAFDLDALVARIARGDLSVAAIESVPNTAPDEQVFVKVGVTPYSKGPERYSLTKCRYDAIIGLGARHVTKRASMPLSRLRMRSQLGPALSPPRRSSPSPSVGHPEAAAR
jgi:hypothetical protein